MKRLLSDFISLIFGKPEKGDTYSRKEIIGVFLLLFLIASILLLASV